MFFNHDSINIPLDLIRTTRIAEMFFRLDTSTYEHEKEVTGLVEFLDSQAGVIELIFTIATFFFGPYIHFKQDVLRSHDLYNDDKALELEKTISLKDELRKNTYPIYMKHFTPLSYCFK